MEQSTGGTRVPAPPHEQPGANADTPPQRRATGRAISSNQASAGDAVVARAVLYCVILQQQNQQQQHSSSSTAAAAQQQQHSSSTAAAAQQQQERAQPQGGRHRGGWPTRTPARRTSVERQGVPPHPASRRFVIYTAGAAKAAQQVQP